MIGIYGIFKKDTDECLYVGQSKDINGRIKSHFKGKNARFNKEEHYGQMIEQHFINDKAYRLEREAYWIKELNPELNIVKDETNRSIYFSGENNGMYGKNHSEETRNKLKEKHLGKYQSEETKKKMSESKLGKKNPMFGKYQSEETKEKIRQAHLGENNANYGTKWINNGEITKHVKEEELDKYINDGWNIGRLKYNRIIRRK